MHTRTKVLAFFICDIIFMMAANFAHPVTPTLFRGLGLGQYMFGMAIGAMLLVNFLVSPFWGKLNDYVSSRTILLVGCLGYAIGQWFFGVVTTEWGFIVVRSLTGVFTAASFVGILTYIVNTAPDDRRRAAYLTAHATIQAVAGAFGFFVGGLLGEISVQAAIDAQVVTLALTGFGFFWICQKDNRLSLASVTTRQLIKESNPFSAFSAGRAFFKGALATMFILTVLQALSALTFEQSFNYYLKDVFNYSSSYNGMVKGITGLLSLIINSTLVLWLIKTKRFGRSMAILCSIGALVMTFSLLVVEPVVFVISNIIGHVVILGVSPLIQNTIAELSSAEYRNLVMGFYNSMRSLGNVLGALLSGFLYMLNPKMPFVFGIAACVLSVFIAEESRAFISSLLLSLRAKIFNRRNS